MSVSHRISTLVDSGQYSAAQAVLGEHAHLSDALQGVRIFLESQTGDLKQAQTAAELLLKRCKEPETQATCKQVIGRSLLVHAVRPNEGLALSAEAKDIARSRLSTTLAARYLADHVTTLLQRVGISHAATELPLLRRTVLASGDPLALIQTHLIQSEIDFKRGLLRHAQRGVTTIEALLTRQPHLVLNGRRALIRAAIETIDGTAHAARLFAEAALDCAEQSGSITLRIPVLGTLAHILVLLGDFAGCDKCLDEAVRLARPGGSALIALNDTRLQLYLAKGDTEATLQQAEYTKTISDNYDGGYSYYGLWYLNTRTKWLLGLGRPAEALAIAEQAVPKLESSGDALLLVRGRLVLAEALGACGRPLDGAAVLSEALRHHAELPLDIVAESSRVAGVLSADSRGAAVSHLRRAARLFESLGHICPANSASRLADSYSSERSTEGTCGEEPYSRAIEAAAAVTYLGQHPGLLGEEVLGMLVLSSVSQGATVAERKDNALGNTAAADDDGQDSLPSPRVGISLGTRGARRLGVRTQAPERPSSRITLGAIERLVEATLSHERLKAGDRSSGPGLVPSESGDEEGLVFASDGMTDVVKVIRRVASSRVTVLITGETGTGKEVLARLLHQSGDRKERVFVPFNCTTVPHDILDSQLFGYRRGAFTGASQDFPGLIRAAEGGTLFLDEIGEMPIGLQPKLLRFLEAGEIFPLGELRPRQVDVRVVAATNADLDQLVASGRFRDDLFYRLNVVRVKVPPLRERREEIPLLVRSVIERTVREHQREPVRFSDDALEHLCLYSWPGNTRQLVNELNRLIALLEPGTVVLPEHLSVEITDSPADLARLGRPFDDWTSAEIRPLSDAVGALERRLIRQSLERSKGNTVQAAAELGLSRKGLFLKRRRLGI